MPYFIDENEERQYFSYDPDRIAGHIYQGRKVIPDEGLSPEELETHNLEIGNSLRRLWGEQKFRPLPGRRELPQWKNEVPEIYRPPVRGGTDFIDVTPNPTTDYRIRHYAPPEENSPQVASNSTLTIRKARKMIG